MKRKNASLILTALFLLISSFSPLAAVPEELPKIGLTIPEGALAGTPEKIICPAVTYRTYDPDSDPLEAFAGMARCGETEYVITGASGTKISAQKNVERAGGNYQTPPFADDAKNHLPEETRVFDGIGMELVSKELIETATLPRTEYREAEMAFTAVEGGYGAPRSQMAEFIDENTGSRFSAELALLSADTVSEYWTDDFRFPVHVADYDADVFDLAGRDVPKGDDLADHSAELLEMLSLDPDWYEIVSVDWAGDPYMDDDGVKCRDAVAAGRKRVRDISAKYGGDVDFPAYPAFAWSCEYREIVPQEKSVIYTMTADLCLTRRDIFEQAGETAETGPSGLRGIISAIYEKAAELVGTVVEAIREHPAETVITTVVFAAFIVYLLMMSPKRRCIYNGKYRCPYGKRTAEKCETCVHRYQTAAVKSPTDPGSRKEKSETMSSLNAAGKFKRKQ